MKSASFFSSASRAFRSTSIFSISFWRMDIRSASADIGADVVSIFSLMTTRLPAIGRPRPFYSRKRAGRKRYIQ